MRPYGILPELGANRPDCPGARLAQERRWTYESDPPTLLSASHGRSGLPWPPSCEA